MRIFRHTYDWVLHWAHTPYGVWALFLLSFAESSFFPIPPDVLLMALAISIPAKAFRYAAICSLASVLGGVFGYGIGYYFMDSFGLQVVELYGLSERFDYLGVLYKEYDAWVVVIAGFTPIPYKVFTIAAGAFNVDLKVFIAASAFGRSLRFFIVAGLIFYYGKSIKAFIEKYFGILSILLVVGVILGFLVIKVFLGHG